MNDKVVINVFSSIAESKQICKCHQEDESDSFILAHRDYIHALSSLASILFVSRSFFLQLSSFLLNSCGAGLGSRESHTHKDVLLLGLNTADGVETRGWIFPCQ